MKTLVYILFTLFALFMAIVIFSQIQKAKLEKEKKDNALKEEKNKKTEALSNEITAKIISLY